MLQAKGFQAAGTDQIGTWLSAKRVHVDLMVPEAVGGGGRRGARLGPHGNGVARKARGLEAALVDRQTMTIAALEAGDDRRFDVAVAGPAALLVAKLHKLADRQQTPRRQDDKDALDVYRLLQAVSTEQLATGLRAILADERAKAVGEKALEILSGLFGTPNAAGSQMAARAVGLLGDPVAIALSCAALTEDLLDAISR